MPDYTVNPDDLTTVALAVSRDARRMEGDGLHVTAARLHKIAACMWRAAGDNEAADEHMQSRLRLLSEGGR